MAAGAGPDNRVRPPPARDPIAVVGIGCRFPGGVRDPDGYWRFLMAGGDGIVEVPPDRFALDPLYAAEPGTPGKLYSRHLGALDDVHAFDHEHFGIGRREAAATDPQQRLLLEVAVEAVENAGIAPAELAGTRVGTFVGAFSDDYAQTRLYDRDLTAVDGHTSLGVLRGLLAGRIAYQLDLHGPAMAVDTACSSALLAIHLACRSLWAGECDAALAGGVNLVLSPEVTVSLCQLRALSRSGRCRAFDAGADGYVRGEGAGIVVLRRLSDALERGERVIAVVRGSAVNHDGRSNGISAPNLAAQEAVVRAAVADAGVAPADVDYVEAHGTGTALGDPIEVRALAAALGAGRTDPLKVGAVKSNIGHLEAAAGVAGFAKLALALSHGEVPPSLHYETPNPHIPWARLPIEVVARPLPLTERDGRRAVGGISAFGMSGTNVHMVLEAPPAPRRATPATEGVSLVPLSARTPEALRLLVDSYVARLSAGADAALADIAYTAAVGRSHHPVRMAVLARSTDELLATLRACPEPQAVRGAAEGLPFVFGDDLADPSQLLAVLTEAPLGRSIVAAMDEALARLTSRSLSALLHAEEPVDRTIAEVCVAVAAARFWEAAGLRPTAVLGLGRGEYAAAHVAGAMDLEALVALLRARGEAREDVDATLLRSAFAAAARQGTLAPPRVPVISGFLGRIVGRELKSPYYWADQAVNPTAETAFAALGETAGGKVLVFGSNDGAVTAGLSRAGPADGNTTSRNALTAIGGLVCHSGADGIASWRDVLAGLGAFYRAGANIDWRAVLPAGRRVALPATPFARVDCRIERGRTAPVAPEPRHMRIDVAGTSNRHVRTALSASDLALLEEHTVAGAPTVPAAALCDIATGAGLCLRGAAPALEAIRFLHPMPVTPGLAIQTVVTPDGTFEIFAGTGGEVTAGEWILHAAGRFREPGHEPLPTPAPLDEASRTVPGAQVYAAIAEAGVTHGPSFRALRTVRIADTDPARRCGEASRDPSSDGPAREAEALVVLPHAAAPDGTGFTLHPVLLDAAIVGVQPLLPAAGEGRGWLPVALSGVDCPVALPSSLVTRARITASAAAEVTVSVTLFADDGTPVGRIGGVTLRAIPLRADAAPGARPAADLYRLVWEPLALPVRPPASASVWAILGRGALADLLARRTVALGHRVRRDDERGADHVVVVADPGDAVESAARLLDAVRSVAMGARLPKRLAVVTEAAHRADDGTIEIAGAAATGLARVVRREVPGLDLVTVEVAVPLDDIAAEAVLALVAGAARGEEIALRPTGPAVRRLVGASADTGRSDAPVVLPQPDLSAPGPGEVAIDVVVSGLNFRDVLHHLGRLPESAARMPYGLECSGRVAAVGPGVEGLAPGDDVVAGLPVGSLSGRVVVDRAFVVPKPARLSHREAATLPLVFITAHYGLERVAGLRRGQRVLIHAAAGGVGQAAIQVAKRIGAEIFATASPGKWDLLKAQGVRHVYNSRDGAFGEAILEVTGGEGVDVVLNSLAGEIVTASIACLAAGGHFVEIGKMEPWPEARIAALPRGIRFTAFDLWDVKVDTVLVAETMAEMVARIEDGTLAPLPLEAFPIGRIGDAFQHMARARHVGKIVIDQDARAFVAPGAAWLVTGGLGGLGLHAARWLVQRGAEHVVLVGRSEPGEAARAAVAALEAAGTTVWTAEADVADEAALAGVLQRIAASGRRLGGIVHAAGVLADGALAQQSAETVARVMAPKLGGAAALDRLTRAAPPDAVILYASAAGVLGNPGQANYAAANAALDAFAAVREDRTTRTVAVDWGPWAEIGMAATMGAGRGDGATGGVAAIRPEEAGELLDCALLSGETQTVAIAADWAAVAKAARQSPLLAHLAAPDADDQVDDGPRHPPILAELEPLSAAERVRVLRDHVRRLVAHELEMEVAAVDPRQELATLGFDSMMNIELQAALEAGLGVQLGLTLIFDHPTVDAMTRHLLADVIDFATMQPAATTDTLSKGEGTAADGPEVDGTGGATGPAVSETDAALMEELATLTHLRPS